VDEDGSVCQSNAILRHIGRKHGLMGASLADAAAIDMLVDGVEDLKRK
jgi:glutathione S-transferase